MSDPLLEVDDLQVRYDRVLALSSVDLTVGEGEIVSVIGPNGAGKSTLADAIAGLLDYDGSIRFRGVEVADRRTADLVEAGMIYCTETRDLFDYLDVETNLRLGAYRLDGDVSERFRYVYDLFPTLADRRDQDAVTMSGGEQQMLALGRALMGDPDLLILDEPTLGLAPVIVEDIGTAIEEINDQGVSLLLCEQDVTFALQLSDRIHLLENGRIVQSATPDELRGDEYIQETYLGQ
ncbi:MAG: ABC transporter ATP-binding protein [Halobacteriota archaeon]